MIQKNIVIVIFLCFITAGNYAQSVGGTTSGAQTYCDTLNSGFVSLLGYTGNIVTWQYSINGGANWISNGNVTTSQSYFNLKQTTCYRAIVQNGAFPPDTSTVACITIYLPSVGGNISGGGVFCGSSSAGSLTLSGNVGNVLYWQISTNNGNTWTNISNTSTTLAYSNITQNTLYRAIVRNSSFCLNDTSSVAGFTINPSTVAGALSPAGPSPVCYSVNSSSINLTGNVGNVLYWLSSTDNGITWSTLSNTTNTLILNGLTQTTVVKAVVQSANCSIDSTNGLNITVLSPPAVNAGTDTIISAGQSAFLHGTGSGTPSWLPAGSLNNPAVYNPVATPLVNTIYILTVTDANSCINSDTVLVTVIPLTFEGVVSNVFSPNGDGINDTWYIENIKYYPENEVTVYNIYGNEVYTAKPYQNDWQGTYNGNPLPDGTYFYVIKIDNASPVLKGSLDILRNK